VRGRATVLVDGDSTDGALFVLLGGQAVAAGGFDAVAENLGDGDDVLAVAETGREQCSNPANSPGGSMASRPAPQARQRAEERKRRGSRSDQLYPMQLSGVRCNRIGCNIVTFNATEESIAWSGCV
jgi:hypothetical protein